MDFILYSGTIRYQNIIVFEKLLIAAGLKWRHIQYQYLLQIVAPVHLGELICRKHSLCLNTRFIQTARVTNCNSFWKCHREARWSRWKAWDSRNFRFTLWCHKGNVLLLPWCSYRNTAPSISRQKFQLSRVGLFKDPGDDFWSPILDTCLVPSWNWTKYDNHIAETWVI